MSGAGDGDGSDQRAVIARMAATIDAMNAALSALSSARLVGVTAVEPTITIRALYDAFKRVRSLGSSWKDIEDRLAPLLRLLGDFPAARLDAFKWSEHMGVRAGEDTRFGRPPSAKTLAIELVRANQLMTFGVKHKFLTANPLAEVERPRVISERETWLDESAVDQLLDGVELEPNERNRVLLRAFVLLCCDSMLRFSEARGLRRGRIRNGVVDLSAKATKSKRKRLVGLTPRTLAALDAIPPVVGDDRVFCNPITGKLFGQTSIRNWFRAAVVASGVDAMAVDGERIVIHTMRHSGASAADARGASALAIRDALGHSSLAITEKYLHRHREAGARDLARLMAADRLGPQRSEAEGPTPERKLNR